jgi:hypothetical protein
MTSDPVLRALLAEHDASPHGYRPPPEVATAQKARRDLLDRVESRGWDGLTRDEKRLIVRYDRAIEAHHADLVAKHSPTAPNTSKEHDS